MDNYEKVMIGFGVFLIIALPAVILLTGTIDKNYLLISPTSEQIKSLYISAPGKINITVAKDDNSLINFTDTISWYRMDEIRKVLNNLDIKYLER